MAQQEGVEMIAGAREDRYVPRGEAARLADVHVNTIRLWEQNGRLHPRKEVNGRVMISLEELEAVVRERQQSGPGDHDRLIELEVENRAYKAENALLRETLTQLRGEHEELLRTVIELARGKGQDT